MKKLLTLIITVTLFTSCIEDEKPNTQCQELYDEYNELRFKAIYGAVSDKSIFDLFIEINKEALENCSK